MRFPLYLFAAVGLNVLWYFVLLIPPNMRKTLGSALELNFLEAMVLLQFGGLLTAVVFRRWIISARGWGNLLRGMILPFIAGYTFIIAMLFYKSVAVGLGGGDIGTSLVYGPWFMLTAWYVVFPMGLLCQFVMKWAGRS